MGIYCNKEQWGSCQYCLLNHQFGISMLGKKTFRKSFFIFLPTFWLFPFFQGGRNLYLGDILGFSYRFLTGCFLKIGGGWFWERGENRRGN